jgi:type I restriction enzyme S subunit
MTPQKLRNSILQLAIQGKLVEQRPEEGTSEELYQQIQTEKQQLIKEGKIKKEKPLPEITEDEIPFDIPEGWKWVSFGHIINLLSGQDLLSSEYNDCEKGIPYITGASNIEESNIIVNRWTECARAIARKGDLLLTCKGTVGKTAILNDDRAHIARQIMAITPIIFDVKYIKYYLEYQIIYLQSKAKSMIPGINRNTVLGLGFPLPPLSEQKRIIAKIEELLAYINRYEKAWSKLEELNKCFPIDLQNSILQIAIQGKLVEQRPEEGSAEELYQQIQTEKQRLIKEGKLKKEKPLPEIPKDEIPFDIPESWKWVKLGNVISVLGGKRIPAGRTLTTVNTGHKYIRVSDMKNGSNQMDNLMYVPEDIYPAISKYIINKEDVYITVAGTIGKVGKIPDELDGANLTENADRLVFSLLDQDWLIKCLESSVVQTQIADATTKVGQPKLAIKRIQEIVIPLPPLAEQKRIVAKLEEILPLCEKLKK